MTKANRFTCTAIKDEQELYISWTPNRIEPALANEIIEKAIARFSSQGTSQTTTSFLQECSASLQDPTFCFWIISEWADRIIDLEGETGIISEPGRFY